MNARPFLSDLLWPLSLLYGAGVDARVRMYRKGWLKQKRLKAAVISIGNLSVGGTGKTPMVIWLAERFLVQGKRVAILSRGYRGSEGSSDEVQLMKFRLQNRVAFGVGKNRFAEGKRLEAERAVDIFLLDDGFQHLELARDLDILLLDASRPMRGEPLLPAGRLREPLSAMSRANVVVFTRTEVVPGAPEAVEKLAHFPVFAATTRLLGFRRHGGGIALESAAEISGGPFFAFCGIGNPEAFFQDLQTWGLGICGRAVFGDHHRYTEQDVLRIKKAGAKDGAKAFITTEKDAQNLSGLTFEGLPLFISVIDMAVSPEADFLSILDRLLAAKIGAAA
ncbi:MAG: tetraacyldisaccharide 4'-kinase [Acidobacteria bacterium]|nr:MAG: tetraacyldisaccharide 4'-kinase [Acidobacteria bacterium 13_2_20CM_58_27]PYT66892.1 MAG: tetraacyldisaccharide 4'-kinase [Acidobacteriota bacterium]PYT83170.1 MAG: tetraacyldisaccharide 4'-kinase [Acidobacteriota bacterium]